MLVFTDGCCLGNSGPRHKRRGGVGVFFGQNSPHNISRFLDEQLLDSFCLRYATNQVAELMAVLFALDAILGIEQFSQQRFWTIYSDSMYTINVCTKWIDMWKKNNWNLVGSKNSDRSNQKSIKNVCVIKDIDALLQVARNNDIRIGFEHVKAHTERPSSDDTHALELWMGNDAADRLAKSSAHSGSRGR